jgi:hypothetical protein
MTTKRPSWLRQWLSAPSGWILLASCTIVAFFLLMEHRAHVFGVLPYVLFLLCPLLHLLMHGWHRHGPTDNAERPQRSSPGGA